MRKGFSDARVCSRSQGQPSGLRSRAMIPRSCSKRAPERSAMSGVPRHAIIQYPFGEGRGQTQGRACMSDSAAEGEFRVTDRRRRVEEAESPQPPSVQEAGPRLAEGVETPPVTAAEAASGPEAAAPSAPEDTPPAEPGERGLEGLFIMLASSAVVALGQAPDPMTGKMRDKNPAAAADAIDLLTLLREKTEGHRTARETQILDELIYDLQ